MSTECVISRVTNHNQELITIASIQWHTQFIGSFFSTDQQPSDRRPQIAVAGRSNVGKSSLLNMLLGSRKLAKTSSTPGKTRSLNFFMVNEKFYFVDLPGYGYAKVAKSVKAQWSKLLHTYLTTEPNLIGMLLLLDCRREMTAGDSELVAWLSERELPVLAVLTKSDKLSKNQLARRVVQAEQELGCDVIATSAVKRIGKRELAGAVLDLVGRHVKL
ncbi:MAG: YihA family ribosome biogenesis GTP-binding protein [Candidatus Zixiibacteriota bacterium]|nr:MAG: YihA family ribosome biogenesis GTP-binding protein [candidate division Zixibacteria bacterium]